MTSRPMGSYICNDLTSQPLLHDEDFFDLKLNTCLHVGNDSYMEPDAHPYLGRVHDSNTVLA